MNMTSAIDDISTGFQKMRDLKSIEERNTWYDRVKMYMDTSMSANNAKFYYEKYISHGELVNGILAMLEMPEKEEYTSLVIPRGKVRALALKNEFNGGGKG